MRGRLSTWISLFLGSPAAVSVWGCLTGGFSAWGEPSCAEVAVVGRAHGEKGWKELVPFARCRTRNCLGPFLLLVRGA